MEENRIESFVFIWVVSGIALAFFSLDLYIYYFNTKGRLHFVFLHEEVLLRLLLFGLFNIVIGIFLHYKPKKIIVDLYSYILFFITTNVLIEMIYTSVKKTPEDIMSIIFRWLFAFVSPDILITGLLVFFTIKNLKTLKIIKEETTFRKILKENRLQVCLKMVFIIFLICLFSVLFPYNYVEK